MKGFTSDRLQVIFISVCCRLNWNSLYFLGYKKSNYHVDYVIFTYGMLKLINRRLMTKVTSVHKDIKYVIFQNLKNEKCLVKYHMHLLKYMIKDILLYYYNYAFHQLPWQYVKIKLINPTYVPVTTQCFYFCRGFIFMIIMQKEFLLVFSWQNKVKKSERNDWKVNYISLRYYMHCLPYVKFVNKWPSLPVLHVSLRGALRRHTDRLWPL